MGVAPVQAWLAAVVSRPNVFDGHALLSQPEFTLRLVTREDDVCKLFDLLANRGVGGLTHARCAVSRTAGDGDQDVLLRPFALIDDLTQLVEVDLELRCAVPERGAIICDGRVGTFSEFDQFFSRAVEAVVES